MFAQIANLQTEVNKLDEQSTKAECIRVMKFAGKVIATLEAEIANIYSGDKVHGARQQSQLDLIDVWKDRAYNLHNKVMNMIPSAL